ncbi:type II toxin-antitoxin system HipA family toxin [Mycolicibacterium duvalii]|nr:HipA domain-containing protein [Mycolicibacterium duvalii]
MTEVARHDVWLYDRPVGHLLSHDNYTWFEFTEEYLSDPARPVLGLRFEENLRGRVAANLRLPRWFSNLLPEGVLRDWIAAERGVARERELELLEQVGHDLPGAVRVFAGGTRDDLRDLAEAPITGEPFTKTGHPDHRWRFSLAGVGLKFSMIKSGDRFTCTATGEGGDWILKLPDSHYRGVPLNEYTMMRFASSVGIEVPEVALVHREQVESLPATVWPHSEDYAFAVRRFDRPVGVDAVHIEDFAQVKSIYATQKYEGNFESIAGLAYRRHDRRALEEFVRRLTFFVLIGNGDAHFKNWSLIYYDRRIPTLSPAYDIVATEPYRPASDPEDLGLKFAGSRNFSTVRVRQFDRLGRKLGASAGLSDVAVETIDRVTELWPQFEDELVALPQVLSSVRAAIRARSASLLRAE